jgi:putative methionine-R-sulfoxide reductase with GAF domain/HAMP domain-containing protein
MALVFLPLILIPLLALGIGAYVRSRTLLEAQANSQMSTAAQAQITVLNEWTEEREQRLQLGSQRSALREAMTTMMESGSHDIVSASQDTIRTELNDLQSRQGQVLFTDIALVHKSDGEVVVATNPDWENEILPSIAESQITTDELNTRPIYNDGLLAPENIVFLTVAPLATSEGPSDLSLVGVNSGVRLAQLMADMQIFWEQRGAYRVERGRTFVLLAPDILVELLRYGSAPEVTESYPHPIFRHAELAESGTSEYLASDGVAMLAAYEWIPEWNMGIVAELPQSDIFSEINQLAPFTIVLIILTTIITLGVVVYVGTRMLRPLSDLTAFSAQLSRGNWDTRAPDNRDDEIGALAFGFNQMAEDLSGLYRSLEDRVDARTRQVRTASEVARAVISTPSLDDLMRRAVELIQQQFGYYHVSIFLLDERGENAVLRESTGEAGQALVARGHQLPVGSESIIGWVTENNQPRVASDVGQDPVHMRNELLPETRSELAVPLQVGGQVMGALDVQSTEANAFQPQDVELLQTLADQLSAAIQNARLAQISATAADRARIISGITSELSRPMEVDEVMETAARALQRALGQPDILIQIQPEEGPAPSAEG